MPDREYGFKTRAIHAGNIPDAVSGARALPIYQTSAFVFDDTADAAARFALQKYGNIYSRLANPTVASFEERVASLEGGLGAVATASGLGAEFITFASLAGAGDHIVSARPSTAARSPSSMSPCAASGSTRRSCRARPRRLRRGDHRQDEADLRRVDRQPVGRDRRPRGPRRRRARARPPAHRRLHRRDALPQPADRVGRGHRHPLGHEVPRRPRHHPRRRRRRAGRFHWANERFPLFDQEVAHYGGLNWHGNFGEYAFLTRLRAEQLRDIGPSLAPHSAWLLAHGVETLPYRMQAHVDNARSSPNGWMPTTASSS